MPKTSIPYFANVIAGDTTIKFVIKELGDIADTYVYRYSLDDGPWTAGTNIFLDTEVTITSLVNNNSYKIELKSSFIYYEEDKGGLIYIGPSELTTPKPLDDNITDAAEVSASVITAANEFTTTESLQTTISSAFALITPETPQNDLQNSIYEVGSAIKNNNSLTATQQAISIFTLELEVSNKNPANANSASTFFPEGSVDSNTGNNKVSTVNNSETAETLKNLLDPNFNSLSENDLLKIDFYKSSGVPDASGNLPMVIDLENKNTCIYLFDSLLDENTENNTYNYNVSGYFNGESSTNNYILQYIKNNTTRYLTDISGNTYGFRNGIDKPRLDFNFVSNPTQYWNITVLAYPGGTGSDQIPCVCEDTDIFTTQGYINVTKLKLGDKVVTSDMRVVKIKDILITKVKACEKTYPYVIEANSIAPNYPPKNTRLSRSHLIKYKNNWIKPMKNKHIFSLDKSMEYITYYHIKLENFTTDHLVVNGGLVIESFANYHNKKEHIEWLQRSKNSIILNPKNKDLI
jgi:hypothetical protein